MGCVQWTDRTRWERDILPCTHGADIHAVVGCAPHSDEACTEVVFGWSSRRFVGRVRGVMVQRGWWRGGVLWRCTERMVEATGGVGGEIEGVPGTDDGVGGC